MNSTGQQTRRSDFGPAGRVLFDLEGVLTKTASVHSAARKRLFDEFLKQRTADTGEAIVPFESIPITGATSMASRGMTAWRRSSSHAELNCLMAHPKTIPARKLCMPWET
jgi:beta-phosphoglucomutase-like phosphatase (HAD superfamily)